MKQKQLERIAKGYCRELMLTSEKLLPVFGVTTIHHFRVNYKKLRAFLRMIQIEAGASKHLSISKQLKKNYRLCGAIRDLQLHQRRIQYAYRSREKKPETYLLHLKQRTAAYKKELRRFFSETTITAGVEKIMHTLPDSFSKKALRQYKLQQWDALQQLIDSRPFTDAHMHLIRKLLKDLYYNMNALHEESIAVKNGKRETVISLKSLDELLDQLGKFQDLTTEIRLLGPVQLKELPAAEHKEMEQWRALCMLQKSKLKHSLVARLKTAYTSK